MPSKPVIRHHHPGPSAEGAAAVAAAKAAVMRVAMDGHRQGKRQKVQLEVVSIEMADGSDINSPEARARIGRAWLSVTPKKTAQQNVRKPA